MPTKNYRFAHYATRSSLFELKVDVGTTVGALKALVEQHLIDGDDLCPMRYFDQWYYEGRDRQMTRIEDRVNGLTLSEAGLDHDSLLYLEGPGFTEEQADVGRAIAAVRAESKAADAQLAVHAELLMSEIRQLRTANESLTAEVARIQQEHSDAMNRIVTQQATTITLQ